MSDVDKRWDYLSYHLATRGIPCDVEEIETEDYEFDPWRPAPNTEAVRITLTTEDAEKLIRLVRLEDRPVLWDGPGGRI